MTKIITEKTDLIFTEIKHGRTTGKSYNLTAEEFIRIIKDKDCEGILNVGVEIILDDEGDIVDCTADKFYELPIVEQLDMCCRWEGDRIDSYISYEIEE